MNSPLEHAEIAYNLYSKAVGGKAYNGDPLPTWEQFFRDPKKQMQVRGWETVGTYISDCEFTAEDEAKK